MGSGGERNGLIADGSSRRQAKPLPELERGRFAELVGRRRQIIGMIGMGPTVAAEPPTSVSPGSSTVMSCSWTRNSTRSTATSTRPSRDPVWREAEALLKSVPGSGDLTARTLLAELPERGTIGRHQFAALVGVAPINHDSGLMRGHRAIAGGRTSVRNVLYMVALTSIRHSPTFKVFYDRLTSRAGPKKVAIAVIRELLTTVNAIVRDHTPWRPQSP